MHIYWGIRKKLLAITALTILPLLAITVAVTAYLVERSYDRQTALLETVRLKKVTSRLNFLARMAESDVIFLSRLPSMRAMSRALDNDGVDPITERVYQQEAMDTELALIGFMESKEVYDQARLLDAHGREVLRVNQEGGKAVVVPSPKLQPKGGRYYFAEAAKLPEGRVYVSFVDLNREQGQVERPYKPMLRFSAPLRGPQGKLIGVIVLNFYAERLFAESLGDMAKLKIGYWLITDQNGHYLYNPPHPERLWGSPRDLNTGLKCQNDFGPACKSILEGGTTSIDMDGESWEVHTMVVTFPQNPDKRLAVTHMVPSPTLGAYVEQIRVMIIMAVAVAVAILLAWLSGRMVANPLISLTETMKRFSNNDWSARSELRGGNESGRLAAGFNDMAERLQGLYTDLEHKVAARTAELEQANLRMAQSEARTKAILDNTVDAIITIDAHGVVQSFNKGAEKLFGYSAGEVLGQKINMLQPPEVAAKHDQYIKHYLETGEARVIGKTHEERGRRKDGSIFPMYLAVSEVKVDDTVLFTGIIRDITELRAAEDSLRESRLRYKALTDAAPVGIVAWDAEGRVTYVNDHWSAITGYSEERALGDGWLKAVHPDDRDSLIKSWRKTTKDGAPHAGEIRFLRPDGEVRWVSSQAVPRLDSAGNLAGFLGTITDITDLKLLEHSLAESNKLFQANFEMAAVGIAHVAPDGSWLRVNHKLCQIVGYTSEELLGKTFQDITHPDDLDTDLKLVNQVLSGERDNYSLEKRYLKKDHSVIWINLTVSLVRHEDGTPNYFISVVEDIDRRKQAESARAESEQRFRALVSNVPGAVYRCENDLNWTMRFISATIEDISGYPAEDFIGNRLRAYADIIHPDDRRKAAEMVEEALARGQGFELEYRIVRKDGDIRWVYEKGQAVHDDDGTQWLDGAILDVTERKKTEQDNVRLGRVLEESLNEIFIFDVETLKFVQVNQGARQNLGYSMDELKEMTPLDIKPEFTLEKFEELIEPLRGGSKQHLEFSTVHQRKDGSTYPVEISLQLSSHDINQVFVAIIQDVTEKNRARAEIERLSLVAGSTDNLVMILNSEAEIQWVNQAFIRTSGYSFEEAVGKRPMDFLPGPDSNRETIEIMERNLQQGQGVNVEVVDYTKDGRKYWVALSVQPVKDGKGNITNFVSVGSDISERKRAEQELRQQAQIINQLHDAVVSVNLDTEITGWNRGAQTLFNYDSNEVMGRSVFMLHPARDAPHLEELVLKPLRAAGKHEVETPLVKKSGEEFTALLSLSMLSNVRGEPTGFVGYIVDITERKKAEEAVRKAKETAEAASRIKSEFLANMSHELRTPLNAIIGFSEILLDQTFGELNAKQSRQTQHILDSGRHLLSLINDILDLSKVESGKMDLELSVVNLVSSLESSLVLIKEKTIKHGIALKLELSEALRELNFTADERKLKQIMFNLLSNAAKFTPDGGAITVTAAQQGGQLEVSVRDTGVGIDEKDQKRIFEEFEQVDSTYGRQQQGTGLGLALTRKLVELHGGRIWVESEGEGKGSTFSFTIPLKPKPGQEEDGAAQDQEVEEETVAVAQEGERSVLVVDDDPMARELLTGYLEEGGFSVSLASNGAQGLEMAKTIKPSVITLDIMLPDISGFEVLRQLRNDPETAAIPVIVVSITDDREKGLSLGATDFLQKPVRKEHLLSSLSELVQCGPGAFRKILVVDDNPADAEMVQSVLGSRSCQVMSAPGGKQGIETALRERPDLIILDLNMPDISGWDVLEALRENSEDWHPPIVVFTGVTLSSEERQHLAGIVQAVVMKGGGKQDLLREIERLTRMTFKGS